MKGLDTPAPDVARVGREIRQGHAVAESSAQGGSQSPDLGLHMGRRGAPGTDSPYPLGPPVTRTQGHAALTSGAHLVERRQPNPEQRRDGVGGGASK